MCIPEKSVEFLSTIPNFQTYRPNHDTKGLVIDLQCQHCKENPLLSLKHFCRLPLV